MSARTSSRPGQDAIASKGWFLAHKWLLLRRISQLSILALFMISPWLGVWINSAGTNEIPSSSSPKQETVLPPVEPYATNKGDLSSSLSLSPGSEQEKPEQEKALLPDVYTITNTITDDLLSNPSNSPGQAVLSPADLHNTGNLSSSLSSSPKQAASPPTDLFWIIKGNLSSSLVLDFIPLTDPYLFVQVLATGFLPAATAIIGALILAAFYLLVGGRVFCSWVCPANMITDAAAWTRRRLGIKFNHAPHANTRYWFLGGTLVAAALTGNLAMELVNPVSIAHRGLLFGMGAGLWFLVALFLYDLFVASRGWCGHLCPMGAFYSLLGKTALLRVAAPARDACDDCMDCFAICPEPQVIRPALKKTGQNSPVILDFRCTNCGRCIDVCSKQVFRLTHRFDQRSSS